MPLSLPSHSPVLVGGGRAASPRALQVARRFSRSLVSSGFVLHVGCASGVDAAALCGVLALGNCSSLFSQMRVFAAFGPSGKGSWRSSAVPAVLAAQRAGFPVTFWAGGSARVPLIARLMSRSLAALKGCSAAVFFGPGPGSLKVARAALRAGVPVLVSRVSLSSPPVLPVPPVPVKFLAFSFWLYAPANQPALF